MLTSMPFLTERIVGVSAALDPYFCWHLLRLKKQRLQSSSEGDIDLLMGTLEWNDRAEVLARFEEEKKSKSHWHPSQVARLTAAICAEQGGIKWPPSTNHLVAIEAKCAYLSPQATDISRQNLKSTKTSKSRVAHTRAQILSLLRMGLDRVFLLDVIANPPVSGQDGQAWFLALEVATLAREAFSKDLQHRLPVKSPAGHYVWSVGSVVGGDETRRGAGSPLELRRGGPNPLLVGNSEVQSVRNEVNKNLLNGFNKLPAPRSLYAVFLDCDKCGEIHSDRDLCN